jgi:hypothetical protein
MSCVLQSGSSSARSTGDRGRRSFQSLSAWRRWCRSPALRIAQLRLDPSGQPGAASRRACQGASQDEKRPAEALRPGAERRFRRGVPTRDWQYRTADRITSAGGTPVAQTDILRHLGEGSVDDAPYGARHNAQAGRDFWSDPCTCEHAVLTDAIRFAVESHSRKLR